jgi:phospholipase C
MSYRGLRAFYEAAQNGTLPQVSFIVGPMELSEHPPFMPSDGGWLQREVVNAVTRSPKYPSTVLLISYDGNTHFNHTLKLVLPISLLLAMIVTFY